MGTLSMIQKTQKNWNGNSILTVRGNSYPSITHVFPPSLGLGNGWTQGSQVSVRSLGCPPCPGHRLTPALHGWSNNSRLNLFLCHKLLCFISEERDVLCKSHSAFKSQKNQICMMFFREFYFRKICFLLQILMALSVCIALQVKTILIDN